MTKNVGFFVVFLGQVVILAIWLLPITGTEGWMLHIELDAQSQVQMFWLVAILGAPLPNSGFPGLELCN